MQGGHVFPRTIQISGSGPWSAFTNADLGSQIWVLGSGFWVLGFGILGEPRERNLKPLWLSLRLGLPRLECGSLVVEVWWWRSGGLVKPQTDLCCAGGWWLVAGRTLWLVKIFSTDMLRLYANF
jgi:hypothetical protein